MKKFICFFLLAGLLLLSGCDRHTLPENSAVRVGIAETPWAVIEDNGVDILPGEDVTFHITAAEGFSLTGTDYSGEVQIQQEGTEILLTLHKVIYPTRVNLTLSNQNFALRYEPNGGEGEAFTVIQEKKYHLRPNTANAQPGFTRQGHTLTGWNTKADGTGTAIGLGSRVTVPEEGITLYAQWAEWTDAAYLTWEEADGEAAITGCSYTGDTLVIPGSLDGLPVTRLAAGAFTGCPAETVIFPENLRIAEDGCFAGSGARELFLFDSIEQISDTCFPEDKLQTLHINAAEAPAGASEYKESCYADKLDLLILSQDRNRIVFYGGCAMWYNLDMTKVLNTTGDRWYPVDIALNGTVSSELQMQMMLPYLHAGDLFFHTPELTSSMQMMRSVEMGSNEGRLWAGIEYNYDLLAAADLRAVAGELDSLCRYLSSKQESTSYTDRYHDSKGRSYCGEHGEIPFARYESEGRELGDKVALNCELITEEGTRRLGEWYARLQDLGVSVFVSHACLNLDALSEEERKNVHDVDDTFREAIEEMPGVVLLSDLMHFTYHDGHFFDTNYHLLTEYAAMCTTQWMKALKPYLE